MRNLPSARLVEPQPAVARVAPDAAALVPVRPTAPTADTAAPSGLLRYALILGMLTALGAFGIDLYLPAFPSIARDLGAAEGAVQLSLVSYFVALAVGQLVYGPVSDRFGRKAPLFFGFGLFVVASVGCAFATSIEVLIALRFLQGIGACAGSVISRAIVRDIRSGEQAARLFALMILVLGASPLLAPIIGSQLIAYFAWPASFWFLAVLGAGCLAVIFLCLEETNPPARRATSEGGVRDAFRTYGHLLREPAFVRTVLIGGCSQGVVFAYLAGSPFVYINLHGVSPEAYSVIFALTASALIGSAQLNVRMMRWLGSDKLLRWGTLLQTLGATALLAVMITQQDTVPIIAMLLFVAVGCQGLLGPTVAMLALDPHPRTAGAASALMGGLQFGCGVLASGAVSLFSNGTGVPMAGAIAGCAAGAFVLSRVGGPPRASSAHA